MGQTIFLGKKTSIVYGSFTTIGVVVSGQRCEAHTHARSIISETSSILRCVVVILAVHVALFHNINFYVAF